MNVHAFQFPRLPAPRRRRRGIALMLVMAAVAIATVLGFAMLSSVALQNRAGGNQVRLSQATYLAESGLNLATYYLQNSSSAPGAPTFGGVGYWAGTGGDVAITGSATDTVNVTVTRDASDVWTYEIVSTAKVGANPDTRVTKTTGARVYVRNEYVVRHASVFNGNTSVVPYMTMTGDVWSAKSFGIKTGAPAATVSGTIYCKMLSSGGSYTYPPNSVMTVPAADNPSPSNVDLNKYVTYTVSDTTYNRATLSGTSINSGTVLAPSASNPAGIFYCDATSSALVINDNVTINGTLIVEGSCQIKGGNIVINPVSGFPGLIVTGTLEVFQSKKTLTVNGLCYVGTQLKSNGSLPGLAADISTLTINGGLLLGATGSSSIPATGYNVITTVTYNAAKAKAPEMTSSYRVAKGISIVRWGLP